MFPSRSNQKRENFPFLLCYSDCLTLDFKDETWLPLNEDKRFAANIFYKHLQIDDITSIFQWRER